MELWEGTQLASPTAGREGTVGSCWVLEAAVITAAVVRGHFVADLTVEPLDLSLRPPEVSSLKRCFKKFTGK